MLGLLRRLLPRPVLRAYHRLLVWSAMWWYGRPSRHLVVIGVTGTDGKTTTAVLTADLLMAAGHRVALSSSVYEQIGATRRLNESHLTMPGRFALQRWLRAAVMADCQYAVLEVSSEGIRQHRHTGIDFDAAVLTNLTPEHLETHGGFEAYRHAKGRLFERLAKSGDKTSLSAALESRPSSTTEGSNTRKAKRISVVNLDDDNAEYFLQFWADEHFGTSLKAAPELPAKPKYPITLRSAGDIQTDGDHSAFTVEGHRMTLAMPGRYNIANALQAVVVARAYGVSWAAIETELAKPRTIPGRGEKIVSQGGGFRAVVDYALTPSALEQFYQSLQLSGAKRILAVFGAAGGGRDRWKRPELGSIASKYASIIVLTTDDPYGEDPAAITGAIAAGIPASSRAEVLTILDRRAAIAKAIALAQPGDVVAVTGMGAETSMMVKGKKVPWSDVETVRKLLTEQT